MLATDPGPGISAWPVDDNMLNLEAQIAGPAGSSFEEGTFHLSVQITERYPLEPPRVRFKTPIYHPNIDSDGRICLDTLKVQPQGCWSPSININTLLLTIRVLMAHPNADDGLVPDITEEYKRDIGLWKQKALEHTRLNAIPKVTVSTVTANEGGTFEVAINERETSSLISRKRECAIEGKEEEKNKDDEVEEVAEEVEDEDEEEDEDEDEEEEKASIFSDAPQKKVRMA